MKISTKAKLSASVVVLGAAGTALYVRWGAISKAFSNAPTPAQLQAFGTGLGFNSSKTVFVLPYHLGDLPAPELALAKADPAYAAGLMNINEWEHYTYPSPSGVPAKEVVNWFYIGNAPTPSSQPPNKNSLTGLDAIVTAKYGQIQVVAVNGSVMPSTDVPPLPINATGIHSTSGFFNLKPGNWSIVQPTTLEIAVAPVGIFNEQGSSVTAFCTPVPYALMSKGSVLNLEGNALVTAGPSTVFMAGDTSSPNGVYDAGIGSCNTFH